MDLFFVCYMYRVRFRARYNVQVEYIFPIFVIFYEIEMFA